MADRHLYLVSNSHIDPVWLWDKYEGIDEVINTFRSACDRLDEYPFLHFSASSIAFYKWVERYAPDVFERITRHIASGRWEVVGGWLVEADCNLPLAESFIKSAEISLRYVNEKFGVSVPVAYSPDSFGHPATLPTILAESGFKYYVFSRPDEREKPDLPSNLFWWEHNDSRVLCYRLKYHYTQGWRDFETVREHVFDQTQFIHNIAAFFFGVGDHGGGPTKREIEFYAQLQQELPESGIRFSTCLDFFKEAEKIPDVPTYSGDLHYHAVGCYSVNRAIKHAVRTAERALTYTDRVLEASGSPDSSVLDPLWETTVFNQFHDILPGSCSPEAAKQSLDDMGSVNSKSLDTSYQALKSISRKKPFERREGEFRVYNSLPYPVTGPFEIESFMYFKEGAPFRDISGREIPIQEIAASVVCGNRRWLFIDTIPSRSMHSYYFDTDAEPQITQREGRLFQPGETASQDVLAVRAPGLIMDSASNQPLLESPIQFTIIPDSSDTWSHGVPGYGEATGRFQEESSSVVNGELASYLLSKQRYGDSSLELTFAVYRGLPFADLRVKVYWQQPRSILKMEITPTQSFDSFTVQGPGGAIEKRTNRREEPLHGWIRAGNLLILQDGAFAMDRFADRLRITLVRSSLYGFHDPWKIDELGPLEHTDMGLHEFQFRFQLQGSSDILQMDKLFSAFVEPFKVIRENS